MAIADGVYHIDTAQSEGQCIDVCGETTVDGANAMIGTLHAGGVGVYNGNNQVFKVTTIDSSAGTRTLAACNCGKVLEVYGTYTPVGGENIDQFTYHGRTKDKNQRWTIVDSGNDYTVNGQPYDGYYIKNEYNSSLVMDAEGKSFKNGTNIFLGAYNGGDNQIWIFHKDLPWDKYLPVPRVGVCYTSGSGTVYYESNAMIWVTSSATLYPVAQCQAGGFQWRWRWRGRKAGTDAWTGWSLWTSPSGSTVEDGWVDPWSVTETTSNTDGVQRFTSGISVGLDLTTYDRKGFQFEVRRYQANGSDYGATHGSPYTFSFYSVYHPTLTFGTSGFSPSGISIPYTSDFQRNGNAIRITNITVGEKELIKSDYLVTNVPYSGAITIPISELRFIPSDGSTLNITYYMSTIDTTFDTKTSTSTLAYNTSHGTTVGATVTVQDGWKGLVTLAAAHTSAKCWTEVTDHGKTSFAECDQLTSKTFTAIPPLGKAYRIFVAVQDASSWATQEIDCDPITAHWAVWNYGDDYTTLKLNKGDNPTVSHTYTPDSDSMQTSGRPYESVFFGQGGKRSLSVDGMTFGDGTEHSSFEDFARLEAAKYATFRTPYGDRWDVAVTSVQFDVSHRRYRGVTVQMEQRS